jgi:HEAT repeat protein
MNSASVKLTEDNLDKSLTILKAHGCSDLFPYPFEIEAIASKWDKIKSILLQVELLSYNPRSAIKMIAPKQKYTARPILLLDPIDYLLILGFILKIAPKVEAARVSENRNIVHSCRFDPSFENDLFNQKKDYESYQKTILSKLTNKPIKITFVATADIVDFFPRVYLHRLENAICSMLKNRYEAKALMRFLEAWSAGTSYGIPTGPIFSNLLAEALLHEVDEFLLSNDIDFVRYVDDYVIFGTSESECLRGLFLLGSRLQETQGLSLNASKTRILKSEDLQAKINFYGSPDAELRRTITNNVFGGNPYTVIDYNSLTDEQKSLIKSLDVKKIIIHALNEEPITDISSVKFILNVLSALNRPELIDPILDNLEKLYPVSHSVGKFLNVFNQIIQSEKERIGSRLIQFLESSKYVPDFQFMWLLEPFTHSAEWNNLYGLRRIARDYRNRLVRRQAILALGEIGDRSALLDVKTKIDDCQDWEQRAIIYACRALPQDESEAFFRSIQVQKDWRIDNMLQKAVIEYSKQKSKHNF